MSLITSATTYDYESVSYLHEEKQRMFVWGRNIYLVQLLSAATPGMTSPVRKRVPVGQICNRLQAQMDSETGTTSTPLSPNSLYWRAVFTVKLQFVWTNSSIGTNSHLILIDPHHLYLFLALSLPEELRQYHECWWFNASYSVNKACEASFTSRD